jgi:3-oxoacyl-[acyl-carrier-protein] synthase I
MKLTHNPVCIVGIGAITSVGLDAVATAAAVRAGISGFQEHPYMINQEGEPYVLGMVPAIDPEINGVRRYIDLVTPAMMEALGPLQKLSKEQQEIDVVLGLPEKRPGLPDDLAERLSDSLSSINTEHYRIKAVRTAYKGHAAGLMAMESACRLLAEGDCEFCLIGGVDSYIDPDTLDWIEDNEQLHIPSNAWGFIPGEAAAFCLLCSEITANRNLLPVQAQLLSAATALEKNCIKTETVCIGEGLTAAVREAIQALPEGVKIDQTYCDQNGEAYRADEFGFMLARLSEHFVDPSEYIAPADCWGDVGTASGPLFVNLFCAAIEKKYSNGPITLLWASSEDGERAAMLLTTVAEQMENC